MNYMHALAEIGLSQTESRIYLFLLQNGQCYAAQIQAALSIDKVPTYRALDALKKRGYVQALGESRNQQFAAAPLRVVLAGYDERLKTLVNARSDIEALVRDLASKHLALYKENRIAVYEGLDGFRLWNEARLETGAPIIREFGANSFTEHFFASDEAFDEYMNAFIARRVSKGVAMRVIGSAGRQRDYDVTSKQLLKEQRVLELGDNLEIMLSIFGGKVGFYTKQAERYIGVIIDDPMLARLMILLYDTLWSQAKIITPKEAN